MCLFERWVRHHLVAKSVLLLCLWKHHRVLFLLIWCMMTDNERFVVSGRFFSLSFFSLSNLKTYTVVHFVFGFLISVLILLIAYFRSYFLYKNFVCFQFSPSITIFHILFFPFCSLFFWFQFFFLSPFVKVFFFNFILQSNFMLFCFFQFNSQSFDLFFLLLKLFLFSIQPSN